MTSDNVREITKPKDISDEVSDASAISQMDENDSDLKIKSVNDELGNVATPNCDVTKAFENAETEKIVCQTNNSDLEKSANNGEKSHVTKIITNDEKSSKLENENLNNIIPDIPICDEEVQFTHVDKYNGGKDETDKTDIKNLDETVPLGEKSKSFLEVEDEMSQIPPPRRTGRKRKLSCISPEYIMFRRLVRSGDLEPIKKYLESKENVPAMINLRDSEAGTALNEIATKTAQFVDIAKLLIDNDVDVNGSDELGNTPLHNAVMYYPATFSMVELLLNNGADLEQRNISGLTPFEMSDDINLKSLIKENSGSHSTPVKALSDWLTTSSSKHQGKIANLTKTYPALPESPGGILKRKSRKLQLEKSTKLIEESSDTKKDVENCISNSSGGGVKRRRSECDNDNLNDSQIEDGAAKSKRIRFNPVDSYGQAIEDTAKFSSEEDE